MNPENVQPSRSRADQRILGRRRGFLLERRFQLRAGLLISALVLLLLVLLNWAVYTATASSTRSLVAHAPQLEESLLARDRTQFFVVLGGSVLFLIGVFVFSILETHRTAGAEISLSRRLREVEAGRLAGSARLRRGDNLGSLERSFNRMVEALAERTLREVDELERIAGELEAAQDERSAGVARRLRELARVRRTGVTPDRDAG